MKTALALLIAMAMVTFGAMPFDAPAQAAAPLDQNPLPGTVNLPAASQAAPYYRCARNLYVDAVKGNDNGNDADKGSILSPYKTISAATGRKDLHGGDCIQVAPGTYHEFVSLRQGGSANTEDGYVALVSTEKGGAKIIGPSTGGYSVITLPASYVVVDGFDVSGGGGGHCIDGGYQPDINHAHHLVILNNHVHDCGGGGIELAGGDYYVIEGNVANNNAATNTYQTSGISIASGFDLQGKFPMTSRDDVYYHNIIRNNVSHDNMEKFACASPGCHSDGEGIIVDYYSPGHYPYRTLVIGNTVYRNGGNGIQVGHSDNVTVANNTAYDDCLDPEDKGTARGELENLAGSNNIWVNNLAVAVPGPGYLDHNVPLLDTGAMTTSAGITYPNSGVVWEANAASGGEARSWPPSTISSAHNFLNVDPGLVNPAGGDFHLRPSSVLLHRGQRQHFLAASEPNIGAQ